MGIGKGILYGGLGFVLAGPIGAIIGAAIGLLSGNSKLALPSDEEPTAPQSGRSYSYRRPSEGDIKVSILVLIAAVMKADGHVRKTELELVKQFLLKNYGETEGKRALQFLKEILQQNIDYRAVAQQIKVYVNYSVRLTILHFLLDLSHADGEYADQERRVIEQIAANMGIADTDYRSILSLYGKQQDPDWAYKALEIDPTATDEELKKAYRRMAMKYHPDKVASAGEDIRQKATEKFRAINEAYETIKKQRNLK